jgi:heptosyltransferase II
MQTSVASRHLSPQGEGRKILIIAPAWIGDMVMAQTLFKLLKAHNPLVEIDVLAPSWTLALTERMPEINSRILFPFGHGQLRLLKRYAFAKTLREKRYDQAIVLPGSFKSALTALFAKIPLRTGWLGEWRIGLLNDIRWSKKNYPLMIQQLAALSTLKHHALDAYYPQLVSNEHNRQALIKKFRLTTERKVLVLCPGAEYGPAKRWPIASFAFVAKQMLAMGWQVWILGAKKEKELATDLMAATKGHCVDLTGKTSLMDVIDLISLAEAVITNDSGLMHIASALNRLLIVIYGSSSPNFTPPLSKRARIRYLALACSPCFKRVCPLGHFNCMNKISPEQILSDLHHLLDENN